MPINETTRGYLYILAAAFLWSSLGPWAKYAYSQGLTPIELVFFRAATGAVLAIAWSSLRQPGPLRAGLKSWRFLAVYGFVSIGAFYLCYFLSVQLTTVAIAALLLYTAPLFVTVFSYFLFDEPLTTAKVIALLLAISGVACVSGVFGGIEPVSGLGLATGLGAGLTYALYSIFGKYATRTLSPTVILPYILGFGALFTLVALPPSRILSLSFSPGLWAYLAAGGLLGTFIPYLLYTTGLTNVPASNASIVAMVEPVAAAAWGWWLLGESLTPVQLLGGTLVLGAASLARWKA